MRNGVSYENQQSVSQIVESILALMGSSVKPKILNEVSNEIRAQSLDAGKARQLLNWKPTVGYEAGLQKTITWYQEYFRA